jgi:hypothetical protein
MPLRKMMVNKYEEGFQTTPRLTAAPDGSPGSMHPHDQKYAFDFEDQVQPNEISHGGFHKPVFQDHHDEFSCGRIPNGNYTQAHHASVLQTTLE